MKNRLRPEKFPSLVNIEVDPAWSDSVKASLKKKAERAEDAIFKLDSALQQGEIRNAALNDIKRVLSNQVSDGWRHVVRRLFLDGGLDSHQKEVEDLYYDISVMGLHDLISAEKKLSKTKATGEIVDLMRSFVSECLPLTLAVAELKKVATRGREIKPKVPDNPDKLVKTCACCFRDIAVQGGDRDAPIVAHGYRRPEVGWQTASCPGVDFQCLEVSSAGLEWMIEATKRRLEVLTTSYANRDSVQIMQKSVRTRLAPMRYKDELIDVRPGDPDWIKLFNEYVVGLEQSIDMTRAHIDILQEKLQSWEPEIKEASPAPLC